MAHLSGKALAAIALSTLAVFGVLFLLEKDEPEPKIIDSAVLSKSGIRDLSVEYTENKIYLNVELSEPKTCPELIKSLGIHPIEIKSKIYQPSCTKMSESLMRITYTISIAA